ncbi:dolichyl-diphosphooligosaccharide--protein glycosyltransferase subunit 1-like [Myotis daubentonii]|uniref:dolichyl-diphosphooligosaccharide--protein glycosyltransferase subunit 1-like n=1 Tax=Myotis daubentonii TaxID=98922 RepID=UPI0028735FC4|nr:dolichyl-diphosphooligosaccharide--protein glycosyltransferase subunit 1-like [Myotis daubentonii]
MEILNGEAPSAFDLGTRFQSLWKQFIPMCFSHIQPRSLNQRKQFVVSEANHYLYTPYPTKTQTMHVKFASQNVKRYTKLGNSTWFGNLLDYGPFRDSPAYSQDAIQVHYASNSPFLTITSMMQVIKVSHWDNIAAEANVDLKHTKLYLGPFPHYDDQRQPESGLSSICSFKTILPADGQDVITRMRLALFSLATSLLWITPWRWKYSLASLFCWVKDPLH